MDESTSTKKYIFYTVLAILIVSVLFGVFYYFMFPSSPSENTATENKVSGGSTSGFPPPQPSTTQIPPANLLSSTSTSATSITPKPLAPESKLIQLTDFSVASFGLNRAQDRVLFYKKDGGNMFSYELRGKTKDKISNMTIVGIFDVAWNTADDRRVVNYLDQETVKSFIHIGSSSVALLPQDIRSPAWSPDGKSLAYLIENDGKDNLVISDNSGRNQRTAYTTPVRDVFIQWITSNKIIFETAPSGFAEGFVFAFSRSRGTFDIIARGFGISSKWSPDGSLALVSKTNPQGKELKLSIYDARGNEIFDPSIATVAQKCLWVTSKKAYCAVPKGIPSASVWPDDYLQGQIQTGDKIILIDIAQKEVREVFSQEVFDMSNLLVTRDESFALFIDRNNGTLWSVKLK